MAVELVTGDTGSVLVATCTDNETGGIIDLTGAQALKLRWKKTDGTIAEVNMTPSVTPSDGTCRYQFLVGEIIAPKMKFEVEITDATGFIISNLTLFEVAVRREMA
jgi:hypothetical protein